MTTYGVQFALVPFRPLSGSAMNRFNLQWFRGCGLNDGGNNLWLSHINDCLPFVKMSRAVTPVVGVFISSHRCHHPRLNMSKLVLIVFLCPLECPTA